MSTNVIVADLQRTARELNDIRRPWVSEGSSLEREAERSQSRCYGWPVLIET